MEEDPEKKQQREDEEKRRKKLSKIAMEKYLEEKETLQKNSKSSFGFGQANRFANNGDMVTVAKNTPGPIYQASDRYKYKTPSAWKIGTSERPPISTNEKFDYFDQIYSEKHDFAKVNKKWRHIKGGAMPLEPRIKYDYKDGVPGPGRYEPDIKPVITKPPAYFLGEKTNASSLTLLIGTNEVVGPGSYGVIESKKTSKHHDSPKWTIGKDKRKGLNLKTWTKNETYHLYSAVGSQIITHKRSEPQMTMGKSSRDKQRKLGMFPSMMSKQATRISLPHPKI